MKPRTEVLSTELARIDSLVVHAHALVKEMCARQDLDGVTMVRREDLLGVRVDLDEAWTAILSARDTLKALVEKGEHAGR
jgi:ATP-dependent Zn protease